MTGETASAQDPVASGAPAAARTHPGQRASMMRVTSRRSRLGLPLGVLLVGLVVTAALVAVSAAQYRDTESRLLTLRVRELASVIEEAVPNLRTTLFASVSLVEATDGSITKFRQFATRYAGVGNGQQFASMSLWRLGTGGARPMTVVGTRPYILSMPAGARAAFFTRTAHEQGLAVLGERPPLLTHIGYAYVTDRSSMRFLVYAESVLPQDRRSHINNKQAFSDLNYAFYLGARQRSGDLLVTSVRHPPLRGATAEASVPFGDTVLSVVAAPRQSLVGTLPQRLPWLIAILGVLLSAGASILTGRLMARRQGAELIAERLESALRENQQLYAEQRSIAQTLQQALLPGDLPQIAGAEAAARYEPGERGVEVGGDWYDVIALDDQHLMVVVGDVSGHGLPAATLMASLRYAIRAYAIDGDAPEQILGKLSALLDLATSHHFATVLCARIDVGTRQIEVSSAGHLPPLLVGAEGAAFVSVPVSPPVGVAGDRRPASATVTAPPGGLFIAFTDGLVERRGESLDEGLERLRTSIAGTPGELEAKLSEIMDRLRHPPADDDTAIVAVRWRS